jgi:glutamyl-tRNA reductase
MLSHYKLLTVTHRDAPLEQIGRFVLPADQAYDRLRVLRDQLGVEELFYLPTCNRALYLFTSNQELTPEFRRRFFNELGFDLPEEQLKQVRRLEGIDVVEHLYEVAASIDSLVIGERQILGQLREAFDRCIAEKLISHDLRLLLQRTVLAAKDVYANTRIGEKSVSIVSLAVQKLLSRHIAREARILLIGAGQTNGLVAKFLKKHHYENVTAFNRSYHKAEDLVERFTAGRAFPLESLSGYVEGFDVLFVCTGATDPIVTTDVIQNLLAGEAAEQKIVIDLAVPHNVSRELRDNPPFQYIEIDSLRHLAEENHSFRENEILRANHILSDHRDDFTQAFRERRLELALRGLPQEIKAVRQRAVNEVFRKEIEDLDGETRELMDRMLSYMEKKCIGIPMKAAREALL